MENTVLSLQNITKKYHNHLAVNNVSFDVEKGKIFGLLGPNGAGKTSIIRMITSITQTDSGIIYLNGEKLNQFHPEKIGYMPEERGLYKKMKVGEQLIYLARLKGLTKQQSLQKLKYWFEKFDIVNWWDKKVEELSKGMQQKIQFIATVLHQPDLIILDEPFSGLDPVNANLIKDEIIQLKNKGVSIIFSTHRMEQVEEICDKIVLIHQGEVVLEGTVKDIKNQFKQNIYKVEFEENLVDKIDLNDAEIIEQNNSSVRIKISAEKPSNYLLQKLITSNYNIVSFNEELPSLNQIFIEKVGGSNE
jgi:ABC-2 type transport system ATP-binding protein